MEALAARLGRDGSKEMTTDYDRRDEQHAQADFAQARGIEPAVEAASVYVLWIQRQKAWLVEQKQSLDKLWTRAEKAIASLGQRAVEKTRDRVALAVGMNAAPREATISASDADTAAVSKPKGRFDGLNLKPLSRIAAAPIPPAPAPVLQAMDTFLRLSMELVALEVVGIKPAEYEKAALAQAKADLLAIKPNVIEVLVSADRHDPAVAHARRTLTGVERATAVWAGIVREERALANPTVRAVRLVERWDVIAKDFQSTGRDRYGAVRPEMAATLRKFSKAIIRSGPSWPRSVSSCSLPSGGIFSAAIEPVRIA